MPPTQNVYPVGITSLESIGLPTLASFGVYPDAIASVEAIGSPRFPVFTIGIPSIEVFGSLRLPIFTFDIPSFEEFGFVSFSTLYQTGIPSAEIFGSPRLNCFPNSVVSGEVFGSPYLQSIVVPIGISSAETFGTITFVLIPPVIATIGIGSEETFGSGLTVAIISNSINYLPVYNQEQDFFKMICDMVDYVRTRDYLQWIYEDEQVILDKIKEVIPIYHDVESILAYYKLLIKPIIGTRTVLDYLGKLLEFDETEIQEWFEYGGNVWHFKVFLGKVAIPIADFGATYDSVFNLIMDYKNERSYLEELHIYVALYTDLFVGMIPLCGEDVTIYDMEIMVTNVREVNSIFSGELFGIPRLQIMPLGLASDETIGSPALNGMVPFSVASGEVFGTIRLPVHPTGFQEEDFGSPRLPVLPQGIISREEVNIFTYIKLV
jgi:hypothetical protein